MWLNLLIKRFGFRYHIEQREFDIDELVVAPRGHKLKENDEPLPEGNAQPKFHFDTGRVVLDSPGFLVIAGVANNLREAVTAGRAQPLSRLVDRLTEIFAHPVIDKTGLMARYDYVLTFNPPQATIALPGGPSFGGIDANTALQEQLGLRLVKGKGKLDVVVVDHIEDQPT